MQKKYKEYIKKFNLQEDYDFKEIRTKLNFSFNVDELPLPIDLFTKKYFFDEYNKIATSNFTPAFLIGGALALIALLAVWILCPKIEPLKPKLEQQIEN